MLKDSKIVLKDNIFNVLFLVFVFIFTFPRLEPDYAPGLDSSFNWAYNYLFLNNYDFLLNLVHAYGPFGFIKKPVAIGNNFLISVLVYSTLKILLLGMLIWLNPNKNKKIYCLIIFIIAYFLNFDLLFVGLSFLCAYFFTKSQNYWFYLLLCILSITAVYIKVSIGIMSFPLIFISWLPLIKPLQLKKLIVAVGIFLASALLLNFLITGSLLYLFTHFIDVIEISNEYSSAFALHVNNNWFWLVLFFLTIGILFFFKNKKTNWLLILLLPSLYGMWKQSIVREDFFHYRQLLDYVIIMWAILFLFSPIFRLNKFYFFIPIISVLALHFNLKNANTQNKSYVKEIAGANNFNNVVISHSETKNYYNKISEQKIKQNIIPDSVRNIVSDKTIDIYPWDLTYVVANNFNWKPRTTLQSLCLSNKHDKLASVNFIKQNGPEFILFHSVYDTSGGIFGSIDYRYMLNDEPLTNIEIFKNYNPIYTDEKFTLLKKSEIKRLSKLKESEYVTIKWGDWVDVPKINNGKIIKLEIQKSKTIVEKIKQFLYKDGEYFIDYHLTTGKVITYRFIPSIAKNGLWINPLLKSFKETDNILVSKIRLRKNTSLNKDNLSARWLFYEKL